METGRSPADVAALASESSDDSNMAASVSSGTRASNGMIVAPCSMKTLAAISHGYDETLVARAAGVTIKESRRLVLMARETPLSAIHLENMLRLARIGVVILPPVTEFYTSPVMARHTEDAPRRHETAIIGGDGRGTTIVETYEADGEATVLTVRARIRRRGPLGMPLPVGRRRADEWVRGLAAAIARAAES